MVIKKIFIIPLVLVCNSMFPTKITREIMGFLVAVEKGNKNEVVRLIEKGVDPKVTNSYGSSALHVAAAAGQYEIADYLIKLRVDLNVKNKQQAPPLYEAIFHQKQGCARLLIQSGCYLDEDILSFSRKYDKSGDITSFIKYMTTPKTIFNKNKKTMPADTTVIFQEK